MFVILLLLNFPEGIKIFSSVTIDYFERYLFILGFNSKLLLLLYCSISPLVLQFKLLCFLSLHFSLNKIIFA